MNNLKKFTLPLFFVFGIALAATATQTTYENAPESTSIDKEKINHLRTCINQPNCRNSAHKTLGPRNSTIQ